MLALLLALLLREKSPSQIDAPFSQIYYPLEIYQNIEIILPSMAPMQSLAFFLIADVVLVMYSYPFATHWLARLHAFLLGAVLLHFLQLLQRFSRTSSLLVAYSHFFLLVEFEFARSVLSSWQANSSHPLSSVDVRFFSRDTAEDLIYASLPMLFFLGVFFKRHYCLISPANFYFCISSVAVYVLMRFVDVPYLAFGDGLRARSFFAGMVALSVILMVVSITTPFLKLYWVVLSCIILSVGFEVIDGISRSVDVTTASYRSDVLLPECLIFASAAITFWVSEIASDFDQSVRNSRARKRVSAAAEKGVVFQWTSNHGDYGTY